MDELFDTLGFPVIEVPPEACGSRDDIINFLTTTMVRADRVPAEDGPAVLTGLLRREADGSTGIGRGLALPHLHTRSVGAVVGVVGRAATGVPWAGSYDPTPVRHVCLLLTPASDPRAALLAQERVVRHLFRSPDARDEAIRRRAYSYWEQAGRPAGNDLHFWYKAERELANR